MGNAPLYGVNAPLPSAKHPPSSICILAGPPGRLCMNIPSLRTHVLWVHPGWQQLCQVLSTAGLESPNIP